MFATLTSLARKNFPGSNRGDVVYGVKMPAWDSVWSLKFHEKKQLFGRHRVAVGGAAPDLAECEGWGVLFHAL